MAKALAAGTRAARLMAKLLLAKYLHLAGADKIISELYFSAIDIISNVMTYCQEISDIFIGEIMARIAVIISCWRG